MEQDILCYVYISNCTIGLKVSTAQGTELNRLRQIGAFVNEIMIIVRRIHLLKYKAKIQFSISVSFH